MKALRIVFMGTPDFAVASLNILITHKYNIVGVITAPDKPAGRGRKLQVSAIKNCALSNNLTVLQPQNLKSDTFVTTLKNLKANLFVVVAFRMLPKTVWQIPEYGTFNLHASLLPDYRGAAPINWAIINGETKTGITTFFIDENIDTGKIILQEETIISKTDTAGVLHDKLMTKGANVVLKTVQLIASGTVNTTPQPKYLPAKTAHKLNRDNCKIDWQKDIDHIYNTIRGLSPYPGAWCNLSNAGIIMEIKIYDCEKLYATHNHYVGCVISTKKTLKVAVKNGYIKIKTIQLPGKRRMDVAALLNGFSFSDGAKLL